FRGIRPGKGEDCPLFCRAHAPLPFSATTSRSLPFIQLHNKTIKMADNTPEQSKETDLKSGPFNVLYKAVKGNTQVLINVRNNHKLLGRVKAYDRHMNLLLEDVKEMWTEYSKGGKSRSNRGTAVNKDRYVSKMFLRGDSVILVVSNPAALAGGA
ncbi:small nuclear ribonucleoprotein Sm D2, partial [Skeletonema marinoi]